MNKLKYLIAAIVMGGLIWYLFIKPQDYIIRFKAGTSPGTLFSGVEEWNLLNQKQDSFSYKILHKVPYKIIDQTLLTSNGLNLEIRWNFSSISDSSTLITAGITEKERSLYNRLTAPFINTEFKQTSLKLISDYKKGMEYQMADKFKVNIIGIDSVPALNFAYVELKNIEMRNKAEQMMKNNPLLLTFINDNGLRGGDFPFLIIDKWNLNDNLIDFRYCFPIKQLDSMPFHQEIKYDKLPSSKALKAIYNGNYITSDRGWFALHEYAKRHHINNENKPIEIFYDNPFYGGDELKWKTEVYLPIKK